MMIPDAGPLGPSAEGHARGSITSPRLTGPDPLLTQSLPRATVADLRFPDALVQERVAALAGRARTLGAGPSLRVWRDAHQVALAELARAASGVGVDVRRESLTWRREGRVYHVVAAFGRSRPTVH